MDGDSEYVVESREAGFVVVSPGGAVVLECRDEHSANHYAVMLTKAWQSGFREGYRKDRG